jgi:hypothetical protein
MPVSTHAAGPYRNFTVSVYARVYEVRQMSDLKWLEPRWDELSRQAGVGMVYLETHRDMVAADREVITRVKRLEQFGNCIDWPGQLYSANPN